MKEPSKNSKIVEYAVSVVCVIEGKKLMEYKLITGGRNGISEISDFSQRFPGLDISLQSDWRFV